MGERLGGVSTVHDACQAYPIRLVPSRQNVERPAQVPQERTAPVKTRLDTSPLELGQYPYGALILCHPDFIRLIARLHSARSFPIST
jgi:hypothetical protein